MRVDSYLGPDGGLGPEGVRHYLAKWTWTAGVDNKTTLMCSPATLPTGTINVSATGTDKSGASIGTDMWSCTIADNPAYIQQGGGGGTTFDDLTCTTNSWCHVHNQATYANDNGMGAGTSAAGKCAECHSGGYTPSHTPTIDTATGISSIGTAHSTLMANLDNGKSKACTACHGHDVNFVASGSGSPAVYTVPWVAGGTAEHKACSCHKYHEANPGYTCADCHNGGHGSTHGWDLIPGTDGSAHIASGHNTTSDGTIGAKEKFDGSEGVTLHSINMSGTLTPAADPATETLETDWQFPTLNVFWASDDASAPAGAIKGLTKDSVITCEDCHTDLATNEAAGPHGGAPSPWLVSIPPSRPTTRTPS